MSSDDDPGDRREPDALDRQLSGAGRDAHRHRQPADAAQSKILGFAVAGLFAVGIGLVIAITAWPGTEEQYDYGSGSAVVDTGSLGGAIVGLVLVGVGQLSLLLATIGYGVMLGVRAAKDPD